MIDRRSESGKDVYMNNNVIFIVGIVLSGVSALGLAISLTVLKFKMAALKVKLDEEYGKDKRGK